MKRFLIGLSATGGLPVHLFSEADCIEIKKITADEASYFKKQTNKPIYFHVQYNEDDEPLLPTAVDFSEYRNLFRGAYAAVLPKHVSLHFGLSAERVRIDKEMYLATACSPPLSKKQIINRTLHNLRMARDFFPKSLVLLENMEFIPEALSKGAYRYIQGAEFFSQNIRRFHDTGVLDGIVFDIAHALITSANHPKYNGLPDIVDDTQSHQDFDPIKTDSTYIEILKKHKKDIDILGNFKKYAALLPLDPIKEIHISGIHRLENGICVDSHLEIGRLEIAALEAIIDVLPVDCEDPLPIILEYNRDPDKIPEQIRMLRETCNQKVPESRML